MAKVECTVTDALAGARLDKAIVALVEGASRARVKRAIDEGQVKVNGTRAVPKGGIVKAGDVIEVDDAIGRSKEEPCAAEPDAPLVVRYESPLVLVVEKPAGQPTAPLRATEAGTLASALVGHYPELAGIGYSPREPGLLHRLDTDTSGLVIAARTADSFDELRDALQNERITKEYLLVCASTGLPDEGSIEHPIANHPKDKKRVYPCIHPRDVMRYAPRPALTHFTVVRRANNHALVRVTAPRAVRHQIRAHFSSIEHPLIGDALYGTASDLIPRHSLHASRVMLDAKTAKVDPDLAFDVSSDLPPDMAALVSG